MKDRDLARLCSHAPGGEGFSVLSEKTRMVQTSMRTYLVERFLIFKTVILTATEICPHFQGKRETPEMKHV